MRPFDTLGTFVSAALWLILLSNVLDLPQRLRRNSSIHARADRLDMNGAGTPFDIGSCREKIQRGLSEIILLPNITLLSPNDTSIFYNTPADSSNLVITVDACRKHCSDEEREKKADCVGRIKSWMYPILFLIVSLEPTIGVAVGMSALVQYLVALGDPFALFDHILHIISVEQHCKKLAVEIFHRRTDEEPDPTKSQIRVFVTEEPETPTQNQVLNRIGCWIKSMWQKTPDDNVRDGLAVILSAMADLGIGLEAANGRLCHALSEGPLTKQQKDALLDAGVSIKKLRASGTIKAWIAVFACVLDFLFLIIPTLQEQISESPSGAKIASGTAFSWLIPLVILHAWYGNRADAKMSAKEITELLKKLGKSDDEGLVLDAPAGDAAVPDNQLISVSGEQHHPSLGQTFGGLCLH
ncbi:hypothetical protein OQA88_11068 [Cercophora sp. LCS_1]